MEHVILDITESGLKKRTDLHLARKIWHIGMVSLMALFYYYAPSWLSWTLLVAGWILFVPFDFLRQKFPELNKFVVHLFKPIMRQNEMHKPAGTTYLLTGVIVIMLFFSRDIVLLTLLFLAFADPIASYVGILYGKDKIFGNKSIQGFLAAFVVCTMICSIYFSHRDMYSGRIVIVSLLGGLIGALAELVPVFKLDDNFTLPVISATGLYVLSTLFGA